MTFLANFFRLFCFAHICGWKSNIFRISEHSLFTFKVLCYSIKSICLRSRRLIAKPYEKQKKETLTIQLHRGLENVNCRTTWAHRINFNPKQFPTDLLDVSTCNEKLLAAACAWLTVSCFHVFFQSGIARKKLRREIGGLWASGMKNWALDEKMLGAFRERIPSSGWLCKSSCKFSLSLKCVHQQFCFHWFSWKKN